MQHPKSEDDTEMERAANQNAEYDEKDYLVPCPENWELVRKGYAPRELRCFISRTLSSGRLAELMVPGGFAFQNDRFESGHCPHSQTQHELCID